MGKLQVGMVGTFKKRFPGGSQCIPDGTKVRVIRVRDPNDINDHCCLAKDGKEKCAFDDCTGIGNCFYQDEVKDPREEEDVSMSTNDNFEPMFKIGEAAVVQDPSSPSHGQTMEVVAGDVRNKCYTSGGQRFTLKNGFTYYGSQLRRVDSLPTHAVQGRGILHLPPRSTLLTLDGIHVSNGSDKAFSIKISGGFERATFDTSAAMDAVKAAARRTGRVAWKALPWVLAAGFAVASLTGKFDRTSVSVPAESKRFY